MLPTPNLAFSCNEDCYGMPILNGERQSGACDKPVIDLSALNRKQFALHMQQNQGICRRYAFEQLNPGMVPLEDLTGPYKRLSLTVSLATLPACQAQTVADPVPTEEAPQEGPKNNTETHTQCRIGERDGELDPCSRKLQEPEVIEPKPKYRTYLSWRFPFVHGRPLYMYRMDFF